MNSGRSLRAAISLVETLNEAMEWSAVAMHTASKLLRFSLTFSSTPCKSNNNGPAMKAVFNLEVCQSYWRSCVENYIWQTAFSAGSYLNAGAAIHLHLFDTKSDPGRIHQSYVA